MEVSAFKTPQVRLGREIVIYKDSSNRCSPFLWVSSKSAGQKGGVILFFCGKEVWNCGKEVDRRRDLHTNPLSLSIANGIKEQTAHRKNALSTVIHTFSTSGGKGGNSDNRKEVI
jgi:hypothetical protein